MSKFFNVKLLDSNGGYLESIPDHLMKRLLAKLLFVHESYKNVDEETKSYFTNCTFPLYVNTSNTVLWEE